MTAVIEAAPRAGRREWAGLAVLALPTLLLSLDLSVLFLALPQLSADLGADSTQQLWIIDIYGFMIAGCLITMGTIGDRVGRRRLLMIGAAAFAVVSVLAAYSRSAEMLIAARALLGIAGATLLPSTLALLTSMFRDPRQRGLAIGIWMSCFMAGTAIGPMVGGAMLAAFWWGSVFLLGVPVMVLLLVTAPALLPEYRDTARSRRPDLLSIGLLLAGLLPFIYGLKQAARAGLTAPAVLTMVAGVAFGAMFVLRQRRLTDPLLDVRLFGNRGVSGALGVLLLGPAAVGGISLFVNQYLQLVAGLSPLTAGLWLLPSAVATVVGAMGAPLLVRRVRPAFVVAAGLLVAAIGALLLTRVGAPAELGLLVTGNVLLFLGFGPVASLGNQLAVGAAPPKQAGSAAAVAGTSSELGIALGVAVLGSIGAAVYRGRLGGEIPEDVPATAAAAATDTLAGATAAAQHLPGATGDALLDHARSAFVSGMNTAAAVTAAALVVMAALAVTVLRRVRDQTGPRQDG